MIEPGPAVGLGDQDPHEAQFGGALDQVSGEFAALVDLRGAGLDLTLREVANQPADLLVLGTQRQVHAARPSTRTMVAVDVDPILVDPQQVHGGAGHRREGLVDLEQLHVGDPQAELAQRRLDRRGRHGRQVRRVGRRFSVGQPLGEHRQLALFGFLSAHQQHRRGAVIDAWCIPGRHRPIRLHGRLEPGQGFQGGIGAWLLVGGDGECGALRLGNRHRDHFIAKLAGVQRRGVPLLALQGVLVLALPGDLELLRHVGGLDDHVAAVGRVPQSIVDHAVDQGGIAHPVAEARLVQQIRGATHALHATGHDDGCLSGSDEQRCQVDGFE